MQNIFTPQTIEAFQARIAKLSENSTAQWGKMNVYQMLKHCTENDKMMTGERQFKRLFIGKIFGRMSLRSSTKDAKPLDRNSPTHPDLIIKGNGDVEAQKQAWLRVLKGYYTKPAATFEGFVHPFFGKMTPEQISVWAYKHIDHHLRQFG
ncbi:MAG: DUF1569 domain-containing protein, partial [Bacteroidota bacterium]